MVKQNSLPTMSAEAVAGPMAVHPDDLEYWAWPQQFSSTAGPFGGVGGQAMTTFTIEAWHDGRGAAALFCNGRLLKITKEFTPPMRV